MDDIEWHWSPLPLPYASQSAGSFRQIGYSSKRRSLVYGMLSPESSLIDCQLGRLSPGLDVGPVIAADRRTPDVICAFCTVGKLAQILLTSIRDENRSWVPESAAACKQSCATGHHIASKSSNIIYTSNQVWRSGVKVQAPTKVPHRDTVSLFLR